VTYQHLNFTGITDVGRGDVAFPNMVLMLRWRASELQCW